MWRIATLVALISEAARIAAALLIAWRAAAAPEAMPVGAPVVGVAMALYPAVWTVSNGGLAVVRGVITPSWLSVYVTAFVGVMLAAALWLLWGHRAKRARKALLGVSAIGVALLLGLIVFLGDAGVTGFGYGAAATRTLAIALIAFAILRQQMLGLDVRVKWTLQKSTIAPVFIAVFVGVQTFVSETFTDSNGVLWGAVAAAGLVFVFNPLQRAAERLSDKAMPGVKPLIQMDDSEKAYVYEQAARLAWKDGTIGRQERAMLDGMRDKLGLTTDAASAIESQAAG